MDQVTVHIEADVNPTESENNVRQAIENMFGNVPIRIDGQRGGSALISEALGKDVLTKLQNLLRRERIRNAARSALFEGLDRGKVTFYLNKQVAFSGHVSFCKENAESPLGPIRVQVDSEDPRGIIEWLAPKSP